MGKDDPTCTFLKHIQISTLRYNVNADMYPFANSMCDVYITFVGFYEVSGPTNIWFTVNLLHICGRLFESFNTTFNNET